MNAKHKRIWLRALRGNSPNGVYTQGRGRLVQDQLTGNDAFCCLGVLQNEIEGFYGENRNETEEGCKDSLGSGLKEKIGLSDKIQCELITLNDKDRYDFLQIADWIERNL